ncbi:MAG: hypothetical protein LJE70_02605, partial [Chromatiaceae bacterium]|nr:hypothetical protein [Chromatiaceae bacterium]
FVGRKLDSFCDEIELPHIRNLFDWRNAPDLVFAAWPEWFAPRQTDWPEQTRVTGFPLYGGSSEKNIDENARQFLETGPPPIAVSQASFVQPTEASRQFFHVAIEAARELGHRVILITSQHGNLPDPLPEGVFQTRFVPFEYLFARTSLLIHSGSVGTLAYASAAGIPQLIVPRYYGHPDHAKRLERVGTSDFIPQKRFDVRRATPKIRRLLEDERVQTACRRLARETAPSTCLEQIADGLEQLGQSTRTVNSF